MYDPCLPQNKLHKAKSMAKERKQLMVDTLPLGAYIASIYQLKASPNLPFTAQSLVII